MKKIRIELRADERPADLDPVVEVIWIEAETPEELGEKVAVWLEEQAQGLRMAIIENPE
jgi:hypothetical protein